MPDLIRLIAEFPLREGLRALLMLALARGGRQAEALAVFREVRRYLAEEFGVEPGERLQETHRQILRSEMSATSGPRADARTDPGVPTTPTGPVTDPTAAPAPPWAEAPWPIPPSHPDLDSRRFVVLSVVLAGMVPLLTCGLGGWVFIGYLAAVRRDRKNLAAAAGYLVVLGANIAFTPWEDTSDDMSARDTVAFGTYIAIALAGAVHAAILAVRTPGAGPEQVQQRRISPGGPLRQG